MELVVEEAREHSVGMSLSVHAVDGPQRLRGVVEEEGKLDELNQTESSAGTLYQKRREFFPGSPYNSLDEKEGSRSGRNPFSSIENHQALKNEEPDGQA